MCPLNDRNGAVVPPSKTQPSNYTDQIDQNYIIEATSVNPFFNSLNIIFCLHEEDKIRKWDLHIPLRLWIVRDSIHWQFQLKNFISILGPFWAGFLHPQVICIIQKHFLAILWASFFLSVMFPSGNENSFWALGLSQFLVWRNLLDYDSWVCSSNISDSPFQLRRWHAWGWKEVSTLSILDLFPSWVVWIFVRGKRIMASLIWSSKDIQDWMSSFLGGMARGVHRDA